MMKKILLSLAAVAACAMGMGAETLTVSDGPNTSSKVPIYGFYADSYCKSEFIIPATDLTALEGSQITQLTWYLSSPATKSFGDARFQIFMKEVEGTTLTAYQGTDEAIVVYEGAIDATQETVTITFDDPYVYEGGNLLIGTYNIVKGSYTSAEFSGTTVSGASIYGYSSSSLDAVSTYNGNFIPKTTFEYEAAVKLDYDAKVTPDALSFGKLNPGQTATLNVTVKNRGNNEFTPVVTVNAPFSVGELTAVAPGQSIEIPVTFAPSDLGEFSDQMTIAYGGETPLTVTLTGQCVIEAEKTVADGTKADVHYPIYGYYFDTPGTLSQMIYPADMLTDLAGKQITALKFYTKYSQTLNGGQLEVSLGETEQTAYTDNGETYEGKITTGLTAVTTCTLTAGGNELELVFDTPYTYNGGNLVVQTLVNEAGDNYAQQDFVGIATEALTSYCEYYSFGDNTLAHQFLPKMTVTYVPSQTPALKGDVNGDGVVDSNDINLLINMTLGKAEKTASADLNDDGEVDGNDVNIDINIVLGK